MSLKWRFEQMFRQEWYWLTDHNSQPIWLFKILPIPLCLTLILYTSLPWLLYAVVAITIFGGLVFGVRRFQREQKYQQLVERTKPVKPVGVRFNGKAYPETPKEQSKRWWQTIDPGNLVLGIICLLMLIVVGYMIYYVLVIWG